MVFRILKNLNDLLRLKQILVKFAWYKINNELLTMKKSTILVAMAFVLSSATSFAQNPDMGITALTNFYNGIIIYPNIGMRIGYELTNFGTTTITNAQFDSVRRELFVDQKFRKIAEINLGTGLAGGTSNNQFMTGQTFDWGSMGLPQGNVAVCLASRLYTGGVNQDVNTSNDETCVTAYYSGDNNPLTWDLEASNINIEDYNAVKLNPGDHVHPEGGVAAIYVTVKNVGLTDIPDGVRLYFKILFNDVAETAIFNYLLSSPLAQGGSLPQLKLDLAANSIFPPNSGGKDLKVCIELTDDAGNPAPDDTDNSNDKACETYSSSLSVEDVVEVEENMNISYFGGDLKIEMNDKVSGNVTVDLVSVTGQMVMNTVLNADLNKTHTVALSDLNAGVYIVNVRSENNAVKSERIVVE